MALRAPDRTRDTSTTTGTGPFTLSGSGVAGYRTFPEAVADSELAVSDTFSGFIWNETVTSEFVWGIFTYSAANEVTVTTVKGGSNGTSAVTFSAGTKHVVAAPISDPATLRTWLGLVIGTNVQAWDAQLDSLSSASANGVSLVTAADYAAMRALLDLEAGTDFLSPAAIAAAYQPLDADLTSWAGVTRASGFDTFTATPSSANLASLVTGETGTGALVFGSDPNITSSLDISETGDFDAALAVGGNDPALEVHTTTNRANVGFYNWQNAADTGIRMSFNKSRGANPGTFTVLQADDTIAEILFGGDDGDEFIRAAAITCQIDGTPGASDMPGRIRFFTTPDNSGTIVQRMRIDKEGKITVGDTAAQILTDSFAPQLQVNGTNAGNASFGVSRWVSGSGSPKFSMSTSSSGTVGTHAIVDGGAQFGIFLFYGDDGTNFVEACNFSADLDGTPGSNDMPGRFTFRTKPAGGATTERLRITSDGHIIALSATTTPPTLATNGQWVMTPTSNTNMRISYRGSDGTTRVGNITLA